MSFCLNLRLLKYMPRWLSIWQFAATADSPTSVTWLHSLSDEKGIKHIREWINAGQREQWHTTGWGSWGDGSSPRPPTVQRPWFDCSNWVTRRLNNACVCVCVCLREVGEGRVEEVNGVLQVEVVEHRAVRRDLRQSDNRDFTAAPEQRDERTTYRGLWVKVGKEGGGGGVKLKKSIKGRRRKVVITVKFNTK